MPVPHGSSVAQQIVFGVTAAAMGVAAVRLVTVRNVVHAALWLILVLGGVAVNYVLLAAEFAAVVQVIIYIGAIVVLFLFGIMLTRAPIGREQALDNDQRWVALVVGLLLFGVLGTVLARAYGQARVYPSAVQRTADVAGSVFGTYVIPFEVVSVVLLAALVGAVVIARRD